MSQLMAYYRRVDEGNVSMALDHLEMALAGSAHASAEGRQPVFLEAVFAAAMFRHNADNARAWGLHASNSNRPRSTSSRT